MLVVLSCEVVGGNPQHALDAAVAVEILHNFTLVHDDVMDHADVRRGKPTVHKQWDENVAILVGDELIAHAYRSLLKTKSSRIQEVMNVFTDAFIQVCEGQGLDKEFESKRNVELSDYLLMIKKKTARVFSGAAEIGALIGDGTSNRVQGLRRFGKHLGLAFQIQDDLLDIVGDEEEFGKTIGGDVMEGKKTYLFLTALKRTTGGDRRFLQSLEPRNGVTKSKIARVKEIYGRVGVLDAARAEISRHTLLAERALSVVPAGNAREMLARLAQRLVGRNS